MTNKTSDLSQLNSKVINNLNKTSEPSDFHTFYDYMQKNNKVLTASMEDYIEMLYRLSLKNNILRVSELSKALNIKPPSANKILKRLLDLNFIKYEKYGTIFLTEDGLKLGKYLFNRHETLWKFLKFLKIDEIYLLDETEKIEHTLGNETLEKIQSFLSFIENNPAIRRKYDIFIETHRNI